jgi:hypothetical protein
MKPTRRLLPPTAADGPFLALVDRFEDAWERNAPVTVRAFLDTFHEPDVASGAVDRGELARELVKIDLEYRWRGPTSAGRRPVIEDYAMECPELGPLGALPVDVIAEEYLVRHRWGDRPDPTEFLSRFPTQADALIVAIRELDAAMCVARGDSPQPPPIKGKPEGGPDLPLALQNTQTQNDLDPVFAPLQPIAGYELID